MWVSRARLAFRNAERVEAVSTAREPNARSVARQVSPIRFFACCETFAYRPTPRRPKPSLTNQGFPHWNPESDLATDLHDIGATEKCAS